MSDATITTATASNNDADRPVRICPRTAWPCPLHIHVRSCGGRFARPADREERLARLILKVRGTDRFRGHASTEEQNQDRVDLECLLCDALWDECRASALDADAHDGWDDPEVRQAAHDLYNDLVANARRATERGDYGRLPLPSAPDDDAPPPPAGGGAGSPARVYRGFTTPDGERRVTVTSGGVARPLDPRLDLRNHSPTGLNWAYGGSGPAQLALALLADALGPDVNARDCPRCGWDTSFGDPAPEGGVCPFCRVLLAPAKSPEARYRRVLSLYQAFKWAVVVRLDNAGWMLTNAEVRDTADQLDGTRS